MAGRVCPECIHQTRPTGGSYGGRDGGGVQGKAADPWWEDAGRDATHVIRVIVIAGIRLYREGISSFLTTVDGIEVGGTFARWDDALQAVERSSADVVLLESSAQEAHTAIRRLEAARPGVRTVALSIADDEADVVFWAEAGASGYLTREDSLAQLAEIVRSVARGEMPCSPRMAATLLRRVGTLAAAGERPLPETRLTTRERQIVGLIEGGLSNKEIGRELCIELATVKNHVHHILEKLDVRHRNDAVACLHGRAPVRETASR